MLKHDKSMLWATIVCSTALSSPLALAIGSPPPPRPAPAPTTQEGDGKPPGPDTQDQQGAPQQNSPQDLKAQYPQGSPQNQKQLPYGNRWLQDAQKRAQVIRQQGQTAQQSTQPSRSQQP